MRRHSYIMDGSNLEVRHSLFKIPSGLQLLLFHKRGWRICFKILSLGSVPSHTARCLPLMGYKINATLFYTMEKYISAFEFFAIGNKFHAFILFHVKGGGMPRQPFGHAVLPVIIPHTKHASSRATAVFAVFLFFPFSTIL